MKNKFCQAAMRGDWAAMGAYADYLEEKARDKDRAFILGLRFCVKYRKFPKLVMRLLPYDPIGHCWWNCNKVNKICKNTHILPLFLEHLTYTDYSCPQSAIVAIGRSILQINNVFKEII